MRPWGECLRGSKSDSFTLSLQSIQVPNRVPNASSDGLSVSGAVALS